MSVFLAIVGALCALALARLLWPLLRRPGTQRISHDAANIAVYQDQLRELEADLAAGTLAKEHYDKARLEIEARLLEDVSGPAAAAPAQHTSAIAAVMLALAIPLGAFIVYFAVGTPQALFPLPGQQAGAQQAEGHDVSTEQISAMVGRLAEKLKQNPDDAQGWAMLGRSYSVLGRHSEASAAFAEAVKRTPNDAQLLADYADALGMAQGQSLNGEPEKLIGRALEADPDNVKALALAGTVAFERKDFSGAIRHWERILQKNAVDPSFAQTLQASIEEAKAAGGKSSTPAAQAREPAAVGASISGVAKIAPGLKGKVAPGDTVFIYARAAEGPRMPLAIVRKQVRDLPAAFTLDDSMAMNAQMKLSSYQKVIVSARVSKTANATPAPGDLEGESAPVPVGAERVEVVIGREVR